MLNKPVGMMRAPQRRALLGTLRAQFKLDWQGIHGVPHWARVRHHGLVLADVCGADPLVVELFAWLHDSQRMDDEEDPDHGLRAANYAMSLGDQYFSLSVGQRDQLFCALAEHSDGLVSSDSTIQTCWDADRLDLGRVGITPDTRYLSWEALPWVAPAQAWSLSEKRALVFR